MLFDEAIVVMSRMFERETTWKLRVPQNLFPSISRRSPAHDPLPTLKMAQWTRIRWPTSAVYLLLQLLNGFRTIDFSKPRGTFSGFGLVQHSARWTATRTTDKAGGMTFVVNLVTGYAELVYQGGASWWLATQEGWTTDWTYIAFGIYIRNDIFICILDITSDLV